MQENFQAEIADIPYGSHLTYVYDDLSELMDAVGPYMKLGLERGEFCLYMSDLLTESEVKEGLGRAGVDVQTEIDRGALLIVRARDAYLSDGRFDADAVIAFVLGKIDEVIAAGFKALRVTAEMSWALTGLPGLNELASYESRIGEMFPGKKIIALCQYHRPSFPPDAIHDVLRNHPSILYQGRVCQSLFYEPTDMFHGRRSEAERVDWMLSQTARTHDAENARAEILVERTRREVAERLAATEQQARASAEAANRAKDRFVATISHELRTPLTTALGWVWTLMNTQIDEGGRRAALAHIDHSVRTQTRIVDDLLDMARINDGRMTLHIEPVDLRSLVAEVVDRMQTLSGSKKVTLRSSLHRTPILMLADPLRIEQIVVNLIANAVKFTPAGGTVAVDLSRNAEGAMISVTDDGTGMSSSFIAQAFDRFSQEREDVTAGGLGLGLTIVKELVELHGGTVRAQSAGKGQGSTLQVRLPFVAPHPRTSSGSAREEKSLPVRADALEGIRVLLIDDETETSEALASVLRGAAATVEVASSVSEALADVPRFAPDVVLTDLAMPEEDGCTFIERVREQNMNFPTVALTAHAHPKIEEFLLRKGFNHYLRKPVEPNVLIQTVERLARRTTLGLN